VPAGPYALSDATIFTDGTGLVVRSGSPLLAAGAPRGALSIVTQGWGPSTVAVGVGDCIGMGGRPDIASAAVAASGAGTAAVAIAPQLRAAVVVGEPLILSLPSVPMRLFSDGVVSRDADFGYSPALEQAGRAGDTWDVARPMRFLGGLAEMYAGAWMSGNGLRAEAERSAVAEFLAQRR
jgi:hypothetical protein